MTESISPIIYPRLIRRVQVCIIDTFIFAFFIVTLFLMVAAFSVNPFWARIAIVFIPALFFEPVLVSFTGGTIGHHLLKLKVRDVRNGKNINIFTAFIRFILKTFLGTVSLLFVLTTRKHQAIHDFCANSIVVYKDPEKVPEYEALTERVIEEEGYIYPSKLRRIFMIILYNLLLFILIAVLICFLLSDKCIEYDKCTTADTVISVILEIIWIVSAAFLLVGGWKSLLFGCKKKKIEQACQVTEGQPRQHL